MAPRQAGVKWLCGEARERWGQATQAALGLWAQGQQVFLQGTKHPDFSLNSPGFPVLGAYF